MLKAHPDSRLTGTPMPLSSLLAGTASRVQQSQLIEAYWALTSATADYYLGLHEADELGKLRQRVPTFSTALNEALSNLNGRVDTSLKAARAAQLHLGQLSSAGSRILPADTPFCGPYVTRYEEIFAGRGSEQARLLSELLPARLNELQEAAEAVERSEQSLAKVAADRAGGNGTGMIRALELLALNRRAFVQIAKDYNLQISRYTRLATPGDIDTGRLVAMLIRTSSTPAWADSSSIANGQTLDFRTGAASSRR